MLSQVFFANFYHIYYNIFKFGLGSYLLISMLQDSPSNMPTLVVVAVPSNLLVPLVFEPPSFVTLWNKKVENYIYFVFGFANKYG